MRAEGKLPVDTSDTKHSCPTARAEPQHGDDGKADPGVVGKSGVIENLS